MTATEVIILQSFIENFSDEVFDLFAERRIGILSSCSAA